MNRKWCKCDLYLQSCPVKPESGKSDVQRTEI